MHTQLYFYYNEPKNCYPSLISRLSEGNPKLPRSAPEFLRKKANQGGYRSKPKLRRALNLELYKRRERTSGGGSKASGDEKFVPKSAMRVMRKAA